MSRIRHWLASVSFALIGAGIQPPPAQAQSYESAAKARSSSAESSDADEECLPHCRANYVCIKGQCVSECNPPCDANEKCSKGQCILRKPRRARRAESVSGTDEPKNASDAEGSAPAKPNVVKSDHNHDGFYLRMGLGLGALVGPMKYEINASSTNFSALGFSEQYEFSAGGTPTPGIVIGGGLFGAHSVAPMYGWTFAGQDRRISGGTITTEVIGPFIDAYPISTRGFHLQAALGPAGVAVSKGDGHRVCFSSATGPNCSTTNVPIAGFSGMGFGLVGGVGYEAFVADDWSLGVIARVMFTTASLSTGDSSLGTVHLSAVVPGLLFGATYQ